MEFSFTKKIFGTDAERTPFSFFSCGCCAKFKIKVIYA